MLVVINNLERSRDTGESVKFRQTSGGEVVHHCLKLRGRIHKANVISLQVCYCLRGRRSIVRSRTVTEIISSLEAYLRSLLFITLNRIRLIHAKRFRILLLFIRRSKSWGRPHWVRIFSYRVISNLELGVGTCQKHGKIMPITQLYAIDVYDQKMANFNLISCL